MKAKINNSQFSKDTGLVFRMLKACDIKYSALILPLFLALCAAALEGFSLSLLAPALDMAVQGVVDAKKESWLVRQLQDVISVFHIADTKKILGMIVAVIFLSEALKYYLTYLSTVQIAKLVHAFSHSIRVKLFSTYLGFGKLYFDSHSRGEMYQIITTNTRVVGMSLKTTHHAIFQLITLLIYILMMFVISWHLTIFTMLVFPTLHFLAEGRISRIRKTSQSMAASTSTLGRKISNALASIPLVKLYGTEEKEEHAFFEVSKRIQTSEDEIDKLALMLEPLRDSVVLICIALLVAFIWIVSAATNAIGVGKYLVFILLLKRSARFFGALNSSRANFAEIFGPLTQIEEILYKKHQTYSVPSGHLIFDKLKTPIEIKNLNFNYPDKSLSLNNISISIKNGKTLAIVGRSGAGKTTLINLIARFYDCPEDSIIVNGKDLRSYTLGSWSKKIAMVGQDSFLFYASLRENLAYGTDEVTDKSMHDALEKAGMLEFVSSLPQGLDTIIGDGGVKLSGGEKQRVSIARAFLRDPEIIILDEPTSALDSQTEKEVQKEIDQLCHGKTVIIIAHRLATVKHADWIVVMESGRVVEQGSLSDLTKYNGQFKKYWDAQTLPV